MIHEHEKLKKKMIHEIEIENEKWKNKIDENKKTEMDSKVILL